MIDVKAKLQKREVLKRYENPRRSVCVCHLKVSIFLQKLRLCQIASIVNIESNYQLSHSPLHVCESQNAIECPDAKANSRGGDMLKA